MKLGESDKACEWYSIMVSHCQSHLTFGIGWERSYVKDVKVTPQVSQEQKQKGQQYPSFHNFFHPLNNNWTIPTHTDCYEPIKTNIFLSLSLENKVFL